VSFCKIEPMRKNDCSVYLRPEEVSKAIGREVIILELAGTNLTGVYE